MIHGNESVKIFCYIGDLEFIAMSAVNNLLEVFLNEHVKDIYKDNIY